MTDEMVKRTARSGGCRLCLAPDSECISIFSLAADKEPIANKIHSCVSIKILATDRLSNRICHACISFLNSWQSFKNRCFAAQKKQQNFLELLLAKERAKQKLQREQQRQLLQAGTSIDQQKILKNALLNSTMRSSTVNDSSIDVSFIKEEPEDISSDVDEADNVDPMQFLAQGNGERDDETDNDKQPPILASLGLTHISQQNADNANDLARSQASCTVCYMQFSNRANARRHERNIHGIRISSQGSTTIIRPKDRPDISPMRLKRPIDAPPIYDYTKPELYRSFLNEPRLNFIRRHLEFLEQYQSMTCKCCNKQFPTYKFFMAHMRKKYVTLSRNLCFKCLKQFQTKPQFIAHLKKRNCLNLYRVFMADDTISKEPLPNAPIRHGSKEIIANKTYGCRLCTETFRLKSDFRTHVIDVHSDAQKREIPGSNSCGYCNWEFEDTNERRRHFSNVECMVFLICGTCEEKFNTHPEYIEHVYSTHIPSANDTQIKSEFLLEDENGLLAEEPSPSSQSKARSPQNCTVCGKQYNNYYNVLRHMESKHPDQVPTTYRCDRCEIGYPRQVELREHMLHVHNERLKFDAIKMKREQFTCRVCKASFDSKDSWVTHQADDHSKFACNQCEDEIENKDDFLAHLATHSEAKSFKCPICQHSFSSERGFETHLSVVHNMTKEEVAENNLDISDQLSEIAVECAVEINGDDDDDDDGGGGGDDGGVGSDNDEMNDLDGNDADIDESMDVPNVKRMKLDPDAQETSVLNAQISLSTTCRVCKETFESRTLLMQHMRSSHSSVPKLPSLTASPQTTVQTHNVNNRLRCRICQKRIHTKNGYKRHMLTVHNVNNCVFIKCTLCPSEFSNDKGLKVHMFRTHNITVQQMQADESLVPIPKQESTEPTPTPSVPRGEIKQMFECNICHTVYRNRDQLKSHRSIVHCINDSDMNESDAIESSVAENNTYVGESWFQCRFCNESFNASKKLTIHMNSHSEYDNKETKCKDCGNVYGTRKSLWVHRQKKHPRIPNPSPCELCDKTFFDKTELFYHLKTHSNDDVFSHLQAMQEQLEAEQESRQKQDKTETQENFSCHICSQRFHDKRVLSKHLRMHEKQNETSFNNSALAAMLADTNIGTDENVTEYNYATYKNQTVENGDFACDMCPKKFSHVNALKVHRGWHFRSPDGRQITDSNSIWRPDVGSTNKSKRLRAANPPVCPYCKSTFASGNNLRRHIVEVHKRNEAKMMRENGAESTFIEKECECHSCGITFNTRPEWVEHKISHARTMKPSTTFEWGCEICGKVFTRKERLLVHMTSHQEEDMNQRKAEIGFESNSQSSMSSLSHSQPHSQESSSKQNIQEITTEDVKPSMSLLKQPSLLKQSLQGKSSQQQNQQESQQQQQQQRSIPNDNKTHESSESDNASDSDEERSNSNEMEDEPSYPCDLCELFFKSTTELRQHVKSHIESIGGGSIEESNDDNEEYYEDDQEDEDAENNYENEDMGGDEMVEEDFEDDDEEEEEPIVKQESNVSGFNCRLCGSSSESHIDMIECMKSHKIDSEFQCEQCQLYFLDTNQLETHEMLCHPQDDYDEDSD